MIRFVAVLSLLFIVSNVFGQKFSGDFVRFADSLIAKGLGEGQIPGAIFTAVHRDSIWFAKGYGQANLEQHIPAYSDSTRFQLGSVGKIFTAIAVLQQIEKGRLLPDADVNEYLTSFKLENPFNQPVTAIHLLTHTAGLDDRVIGYAARNESDVMPLSQHLKLRMPGLFESPGQSINYSNYGYALLGHLVEIVSGEEFEEYVDRHILKPLDMAHSGYSLPSEYRNMKNFARGYQWRDTMEEVISHPRHPKPAGSILSTAEDMGNFLTVLLNRNKLLDTSSFKLLFERQFTNHPLLNGYTCGFEEQSINGERFIAKGGAVPGFLSLLVIYPSKQFGFFISVNTETDNFLTEFIGSIHSHFFPKKLSGPSEEFDIDLTPYTGEFRNDRANHHSIEDLFALFRGHVQISKSGDGYLSIYRDGGFQKYAPRDSFVFTHINNPTQHIVFEMKNGKPARMYRNMTFCGLEVPASFSRISWIERPRFLNDELPFVLLMIPGYLLLLIFLPITWIVKKLRPNQFHRIQIRAWRYHYLAILFVALFLADIIFFFVPLLKSVQSGELFFGIQEGLLHFRYLHWLMGFVTLFLILNSIRIWRTRNWIFTKIYFNLFSISSLIFILVLYRWHFMSMIW